MVTLIIEIVSASQGIECLRIPKEIVCLSLEHELTPIKNYA